MIFSINVITNLFLFLSFSIVWISSAQGFHFSVGLGQLYSQSSIEDLATNVSTPYSGFGLLGELRFRGGKTPAEGAGGFGARSPLLARPEIFFFGGSGSQVHSEQSSLSYRKNQFTGAGIDFIFSSFFLGGQALSNNSSVQVATETQKDSYLSIGLRAGTNLNFDSNSRYSMKISLFQNIGRGQSASSSTGSSFHIESGAMFMLYIQLTRPKE